MRGPVRARAPLRGGAVTWPSSVQGRLLDDAALDVGQRVHDDEGRLINLADDALDLADLEPRDDAEEDVLLGVGPAAPPLVDGHAAGQVADDRLPDLLAPLGDDDDRRVLLYAVDEEVDRLGGGEVGEDGVEGRLDAEEEGGGGENEEVEEEDPVAALEQVAAAADEQLRDLRAVEHRAAADGEPNACADEEAAEDGGQELVGGDVGEVYEGEAGGEARARQRALGGELPADLPVAERDEGEVDDENQQREREAEHVCEQHRDARH